VPFNDEKILKSLYLPIIEITPKKVPRLSFKGKAGMSYKSGRAYGGQYLVGLPVPDVEGRLL